MSIEDYERLVEAQGGVCAACFGPPTKFNGSGKSGFHVDHNHRTGKTRGLLCSACNQALGLLKESPTRIERLLAYITKHEPILSQRT
jgi:hypothetical protein